MILLTRDLDPQRHHSIYFDRYFSSVKLLEMLGERGFHGTGTCMSNRVPAEVRGLLKSDKEMKREPRGTTDAVSRHDGAMTFTKWSDKRTIVMISTQHSLEPVDTVQRWNKIEKCYAEVSRPNVVAQYNHSMGGVDMCDRLLSFYRCRIRTKKWPIRVFFHFMDWSVVNAFLQYKQHCKLADISLKYDLLSFKQYIAEALIASGGAQVFVNVSSIPTTTVNAAREASHMPIAVCLPQGCFPRCRNPGCSKKTHTKCRTCGIFLCIKSNANCFQTYHS